VCFIIYSWRVIFVEITIENRDFLDNYLGLLNGLSRESKIKLVERLNFDINNRLLKWSNIY